jgi:hypothetical protein
MKVQMLVKTQTQLSAKQWKSENERCKQNPNKEGCSGFKKFEMAQTHLEVLISNPNL